MGMGPMGPMMGGWGAGGANVLYMDGHVEFQRYGKDYPIGNPEGWSTGNILIGVVSAAGGFG